MQILLNDNNEITAYATVGGVDGGTNCTIPDNVLTDEPLSYRYISGKFIKNEDYKPPIQSDPLLTEPQAGDIIMLALAELAEIEASHDTENKLALAELAEIIAGGEK